MAWRITNRSPSMTESASLRTKNVYDVWEIDQTGLAGAAPVSLIQFGSPQAIGVAVADRGSMYRSPSGLPRSCRTRYPSRSRLVNLFAAALGFIPSFAASLDAVTRPPNSLIVSNVLLSVLVNAPTGVPSRSAKGESERYSGNWCAYAIYRTKSLTPESAVLMTSRIVPCSPPRILWARGKINSCRADGVNAIPPRSKTRT